MSIVVANKGWAETVPEWLIEEVKAERLILGVAGLMKPDPIEKVGDAEVCVYIYTLGLTQPLDHNLSEIYIYVTAKLMKRRGMELQDFMKEKLERGLTIDEERELKELKYRLYKRRGGEIKHPLIDAMKELKQDI